MSDLNFTYDKLSWYGDKENIHILNLKIEGVSYGNVIFNILTNDVGASINKYIVDNDLLLPIEEVGSNDDEVADEELFSIIQNAIGTLLDDTAKEKNYDGAVACCSYYNSTNDQFREEAQKFSVWRDSVWGTCYEMIAQYKAQQITRPTLDDVLAKLPTLEW